MKTLEEIRDIVAKYRGYENWETLNGSDLYDSDIDEVARMYSESKTAQLKTDKEELLSALEKCNKFLYDFKQQSIDDAYELQSETNSLIQKMKQ